MKSPVRLYMAPTHPADDHVDYLGSYHLPLHGITDWAIWASLSSITVVIGAWAVQKSAIIANQPGTVACAIASDTTTTQPTVLWT